MLVVSRLQHSGERNTEVRTGWSGGVFALVEKARTANEDGVGMGMEAG